MRSQSNNSQGGFSLVEVIVALAIVALMLGTVYQVATGSVRSTVKGDDYLRALTTAQSVLAQASAQPVLRVGTTLGSSGEVAWSRSIKPYSAPAPTPETRLYQVTVVAIRQGSKVELETVLIAGVPRD
jgi:general secretion pathway protein I